MHDICFPATFITAPLGPLAFFFPLGFEILAPLNLTPTRGPAICLPLWTLPPFDDTKMINLGTLDFYRLSSRAISFLALFRFGSVFDLCDGSEGRHCLIAILALEWANFCDDGLIPRFSIGWPPQGRCFFFFFPLSNFLFKSLLPVWRLGFLDKKTIFIEKHLIGASTNPC